MFNMAVTLFNEIIEAIGSVLGTILNLLPDSPFTYIAAIDNEWLKALNWLFPIDSAVAHLSLYVTSVAVYYAIRVVLRWVKAAGGG